MTVLGINASARKDGNTALIMEIVFKQLNQQGIKTELVQFAGNIIEPCKACFACKGRKNCVFEKDMFFEVFERMAQADGILLGSPVYSADVSANMKAFLERAGVVAAVNPGILKHKVGASVAAVRRGGGMSAVDTMNHFFLNKEVYVAGSTYWNMVYGKDIGDALKDGEGVENMKNLGQNMGWLIKKLNR